MADEDIRSSAPTEADDGVDHPAVAKLARDVTLGQGAKQGAAWLGSSRIGLQVLQFAVSIITARLLLPEEFGVAALALAVVAFAQLFTDLGLAAAIVHARKATAELLTTAFYLNVGCGLAIAAIVAGAAYPLSQLYGNDTLFGLLLIASLNFTAVRGAVQTALLERTFNYKRLAIIETFAYGGGTCFVPVAAALGVGAESLVLGPLLSTVTISASLWLTVPWRPSGRPSRRAVRHLWEYSRGLVGFNTLTYWSRNLDTLMLGGAVSASQLGQYNRAFNLMMVPVQQMSMVVSRVLFPSLARLRDEPKRLGKAWLRGLEVTATLAMPITVAFAATAPALVAVLYGPRWAPAAPILELLALSAIPQIIGASSGGVYRALGLTGLLFRVGVVATSASTLAILGGLHWGAQGVAAALLIESWIALPIAVAPLFRAVEADLRDLIAPAVGIVAPSAALGVGAMAVRLLMPAGTAPALVLVGQLSAGGLLYFAVLRQLRSPVLDALHTQTAKLGRRLRSATGR